MRKIIEVIVTSAEEAREAEAGGADRMELVRDLTAGGLTPEIATVRNVLSAARAPVRAMLRESATMALGSNDELERLCATARELASLGGLEGLVAGFLALGGVDREALARISRAAPDCAITFHRAFDEIADPLRAIAELKQFRQIDRILTRGGPGKWPERKARLLEWQRAAAPEIRILTGVGLDAHVLLDLKSETRLQEVHVGRMAREPQAFDGRVSCERIAFLKSALA